MKFEIKEHQNTYDDLDPESFDLGNAMALEEGMTVILRKPNQLLIDLDNSDSMEPGRLEFLARKFPIREVESWRSKSGDGVHVVITLEEEVSPLEALALEMAMGSDPIRGLLNVVRYRNGVDDPSRLFKPPQSK